MIRIVPIRTLRKAPAKKAPWVRYVTGQHVYLFCYATRNRSIEKTVPHASMS